MKKILTLLFVLGLATSKFISYFKTTFRVKLAMFGRRNKYEIRNNVIVGITIYMMNIGSIYFFLFIVNIFLFTNLSYAGDYARRYPTDTAMLVYTPNNPPPADAIQVSGVTVDTTANFTNDGNVDFTLVDGGPGGPDVIKADYTETDPLSLHLNQTVPQTFVALAGGTGLMKVTAGLLGLDTNTYLTTSDATITYLKLNCSNDPLTAALDLPTVYNSLGILKIMPDVQGDVGLFGDTDVANGADGKILSVNRRAAEGDTYLNFYVNDDQVAYIDSNWDISIRSNLASGVIELGAIPSNIVRLIGTVNAIGEPSGTENLPLYHYGYISAVPAAQRYVSWLLDDSDDYFHLTKSHANILGFKINMPVDFVGNDLTSISSMSLGSNASASDTTITFLSSGNDATITYDQSDDEFDYGDADITTTGTVSGVNVTSGADPGHTHGSGSITEADPLSLHLNQTVSQDISNGQPDFLAGLRAGSINELSIDVSGNCVTTGTVSGTTITGGNVTSGVDPGHTHTGGAPATSTYIVQTSDVSLPNAQVLASLATGMLKSTTTTGILSIATDGTDYLSSTTGLKLDQTTPQTIINGTPIFNVGLTARDIVLINDGVSGAETKYFAVSEGNGTDHPLIRGSFYATGLWQGGTEYQSAAIKVYGTDFITFEKDHPTGPGYDHITLPIYTDNGFLKTSGGAGLLSVDTTTYANNVLSNLGSVACNTSLTSDTANTDDLGTEALYWKKLYLASDISFEGATDDAYQTTLTAVDTTLSDKSINIPNASGTMAVSATAPITLSALGDVGITVLKDITTSGTGMSGGADDVLPGSDSDVTITLTTSKDIVAGTGLSGGENDVLPGAEADTTISLDLAAADTWTGLHQFQNVAGIELGKDDATNVAGSLKMWSAGANNYYTTFTAGTQTANTAYTLPPAFGAAGSFLKDAAGDGVLSWAAGGGGLANIVEDLTPQLGGDLDMNSKNIDFPTTANISDVLDEDNMASNSATKLATQQSIKAYADTKAPIASPTFTGIVSAPTINLTGGQIAFPAIQSASADVNTLDDYEEGTWTAGLTCGTSGTITIDAGYRTGVYTKIGRKVTVTIVMAIDSVSSPVGSLTLTGLPFTTGSTVRFRAGTALDCDTLNATAATAMQGIVINNTTTIVLRHFAAGVAGNAAADIKAGSAIALMTTYFTD